MKSAVRGGLRPASLIQRRKPHGDWKWYDYLLFDASQRVDDETCQNCGLPLYICRSDNSEIQFDVRVDYCKGDEATAAQAQGDDAEGGRAARRHQVLPRPVLDGRQAAVGVRESTGPA